MGGGADRREWGPVLAKDRSFSLQAITVKFSKENYNIGALFSDPTKVRRISDGARLVSDPYQYTTR